MTIWRNWTRDYEIELKIDEIEWRGDENGREIL